MSGNRSKKNGKKNKTLNIPEVLQVKSLKLETNKSSKDGKSNVKSDDNLRKRRKFNILKNVQSKEDEPVIFNGAELETCLVKKFRTLNLSNEGDNNVPSTSTIKTNTEESGLTGVNAKTGTDTDDLSLVMQYCPESTDDTADKPEDLPCSYKYYNKNPKSIKFTNQVTVLYFSGEDILCESMEPLKKEQDQQLRNKEMRKEHLMSKGQIDNLYLF